jgi:hypothetical protein
VFKVKATLSIKIKRVALKEAYAQQQQQLQQFSIIVFADASSLVSSVSIVTSSLLVLF